MNFKIGNKLNGNDLIGETFQEILRNKEIKPLNRDYSNDDLFCEICNILLNLIKYLEDRSMLKIVHIYFKVFYIFNKFLIFTSPRLSNVVKIMKMKLVIS